MMRYTRIVPGLVCVFAVAGMTGCNQGNLKVTLAPQEALDAGAQWAFDGSEWLNSGDTVIELPIGDHVVTFKDVPGWTTPAVQTVKVSKGATVEAAGEYVEEDTGDILEPPFETEALFSTFNGGAAQAGPEAPVEMTLSQPALVAVVLSWHTPGEDAAAGGTISIRTQDGKVYGPWDSLPLPSKEDGPVIRRATPNIPLDAGTYEVLDSDTETWLWNVDSQGMGFVEATGVWYGDVGALEFGAEGGDGVIDELQFSMPAGTFPEGAALVVSRTGEEVSGTEADGYLLSGLPETHGAFLVSLPLSEEVPENPMVQVRDEAVVTSAGRVTYGRFSLPAEVRDGRLVFEYPAVGDDDGEKGPKQGGGHRWVVIVKYYGQAAHFEQYLLSSGENFRLNGSPADLNPIRNKVEALATALESAYSALIPGGTGGGGVGMTFFRRGMPIDVMLSYWWFDENVAYATRGFIGTKNDILEINLHKVADPAMSGETNAAAIHELFHLLQYQYAPRHAMGGPGGWLYEMCSVWSEWLVSPPDHYPDVLQGNAYRFPVNGLLDAANTHAKNDKGATSPLYHGYVSGLFLRHMTQVTGMESLGRLWRSIAAGDDAFTALTAAAGTDWTPMWETFCQKLYSGGLAAWNSSFLPVARISESMEEAYPSAVWRVDSTRAAIDGHDFTMNIPPVSGFLLQIKVNAELDPLIKTRLIVAPHFTSDRCKITTYLYKFRAMTEAAYLGEFAPVEGGEAQIEIPDTFPAPYVILLVVTSREPLGTLGGKVINCQFGGCVNRSVQNRTNRVTFSSLDGLASYYWNQDGTQILQEGLPATIIGWGEDRGGVIVWNGDEFSCSQNYTEDGASAEPTVSGNWSRTTTVNYSGKLDEARCRLMNFTYARNVTWNSETIRQGPFGESKETRTGQESFSASVKDLNGGGSMIYTVSAPDARAALTAYSFSGNETVTNFNDNGEGETVVHTSGCSAGLGDVSHVERIGVQFDRVYTAE